MNPRPRRSKGFTLVEVCIAAMIIAIGATALFAVALSTRRTLVVSPVREQMNQYSRRISEELKGYVTYKTANLTGAPGGSWKHPSDTSACSAWALSTACTHDVSSMLPAALRNQYGATLTYNVSAAGSGGHQIQVNMSWTEPD